MRGPPFVTEDPSDDRTRADVIFVMRATCAASLLTKATARAMLIQCPLLHLRVHSDNNMTDFHETWYERRLGCLYTRTIRTQEWDEQCSITAVPPPSRPQTMNFGCN